MDNSSKKPLSNPSLTKGDDEHNNKPWKKKKSPNFDYENLLSLDQKDRINPADYDLGKKLFGDKFVYYYQVNDCDTNKPFFAKILRRNKYKDRENINSYKQYRENLSNELNIISQLNHPSIIKYIGFSSVGFSQKHQPAILTEFVQNGSLSKIIQAAKENPGSFTLNDTQKLINIYGIALGMSYLHDYNILHRNITPSSILENENYYPIISNFDFAYVLEDDEIVHTQQGFNFGIPSFIAPETYSKHQYSKKTDVYSFGMTIYSLLTNEIPFLDKQSTEISNEIAQGKRPEFKTPIPESYKKLIEACWDQEPENRPTFDEIVDQLTHDPKYIIAEISTEEFQKYIKYVHDYYLNESLEDNKEEPDEKLIEMILKRKKLKRPKAMLNLTNSSLISQECFYETFKVQVKDTDTIHIAKVFYSFLESYPSESQSKIFRAIKNMLNAKHPAITKCIEFSAHGFEHEYRPTLLTEYKNRIKLTDIIDQNVNAEIQQKWTATKKLINIYGIASGMLYLHSRGILHRDLTPMNIYEDDKLEPEIIDFGIANIFRNLKTMAKIKCISPYYAPEFYKRNEYTKKSEVYSFALIVYSIITNSIPYKNDDIYANANRIYKTERPPFNTEIPKAYQKLIESCWSENPNDRPSFEKIVRQLKTDPDFITDSINKEEYLNYYKFIDSNLQETIDKEKNAGKIIEEKNEKNEKLQEQLNQRNSNHKKEIKKIEKKDDKAEKKDDKAEKKDDKAEKKDDKAEKKDDKAEKKDDKVEKKEDKVDNTANKEDAQKVEIKPPENEQILLEYMVAKNKDDYYDYEEEEEEEEEGEIVINLEDSNDKPYQIDNVKLANLKYYKKESLIEYGSLANIFKVNKVKSLKNYAAKVFSMEIYNRFNETKIPTIKLLKKGITVHSELLHPLVTKFIGYSPISFDHRTFQPVMIYEYCRNGSLEELIANLQSNINIPKWDDTKKLINIYGIAQCMEYLHSRNILHRDLSLSNVLVNESLYPKLNDFSLAIPESESAENEENVVGSDNYIAPEIWREHKYSKASDVYAYSIIVYSLLTSKLPRIGPNRASVCYKVTNENFRPKLDPNTLPKCYVDLIINCWQEDPSNRSSFEDIVKRLKENEEFRQGDVDESEYQKYIETIDEYFRKLQKQHEKELQQLREKQQQETKEQQKP